MKINQYVGASASLSTIQTIRDGIRALSSTPRVNHRVALFGAYEDAIRSHVIKNKGSVAQLARYFREHLAPCKALTQDTVYVYLHTFIKQDMKRN